MSFNLFKRDYKALRQINGAVSGPLARLFYLRGMYVMYAESNEVSLRNFVPIFRAANALEICVLYFEYTESHIKGLEMLTNEEFSKLPRRYQLEAVKLESLFNNINLWSRNLCPGRNATSSSNLSPLTRMSLH